MTAPAASRTFDVRHVQLARATFAVIAAVMVTFSPDHSATVGLAVFSGFAIATGLVELLAVWLVYPRTRRAVPMLLGILTLVAGMVSGVVPVRTISGFFAIVILWALLTGLVELLGGVRGLAAHRRAGVGAKPLRPGRVEPWSDGTEPIPLPPRSESRDAVAVGVLTLLLGFALLFTPAGYALQYTITEADVSATLTGITIAVGVFGGYAAIIGVYLAVAGFTPRPQQAPETATTTVDPKESL